jgi:hypothetical protein
MTIVHKEKAERMTVPAITMLRHAMLCYPDMTKETNQSLRNGRRPTNGQNNTLLPDYATISCLWSAPMLYRRDLRPESWRRFP